MNPFVMSLLFFVLENSRQKVSLQSLPHHLNYVYDMYDKPNLQLFAW